jgi:hypothetical protein
VAIIPALVPCFQYWEIGVLIGGSNKVNVFLPPIPNNFHP